MAGGFFVAAGLAQRFREADMSFGETWRELECDAIPRDGLVGASVERERATESEVEFRPVGSELHGALEKRQRFARPIRSSEGDSPVESGVGMVGAQAGGSGEMHHGFRGSVALREKKSEIQMRLRI